MFGGAILIEFFLQMGFMPDMNFSEASGILIASALIGGYLIVLFTVLLMVPAILVLSVDKLKEWASSCLGKGGACRIIFLIAMDILCIFLVYNLLFSLPDNKATPLSCYTICAVAFASLIIYIISSFLSNKDKNRNLLLLKKLFWNYFFLLHSYFFRL